MKKLVVISFVLTFFWIPPAQADTPVIRIVDKPHTNFDGTFRNNDLSTSLLPTGKLGKLIFTPPSSRETYVIDAALIDEILMVAAGKTANADPAGQIAAENWLYRLKFASVDNKMVALPYGNPDEKLLKRIAPGELSYYSKYAQGRLQSFLGRAVIAESGWGQGVSRLNNDFIQDYTQNRRLLTGLSTITSAPEITNLRTRLAIVMNPLLNYEERAYYSYNKNKAVASLANKLRVVPGRYQITSTTAKLPITVINNLETASVVSISLIPMNSRMQIENVNSVTLAPKSRQQILVPVDVIAPGSTLVQAQFINSKGQLVGEVSKLNLTATIIDSRVAWFTTSAAVLLLVGAIIQSVRRVRKVRHEK